MPERIQNIIPEDKIEEHQIKLTFVRRIVREFRTTIRDFKKGNDLLEKMVPDQMKVNIESERLTLTRQFVVMI